MKNWIIILLIFVLPISFYSYFDAQAQMQKVCKVEGNANVKNPKAKIIKFSSPMCSECQEMEAELKKVMSNYKDSVLIEEINVIENYGKEPEYNKLAIKKFKVTLVPTTIFLDKQGNTIYRQEGVIPAKEIKEILDGIK